MIDYLCMSVEELTLWRDQPHPGARATAPCTDCPLWFHLQEKAAGRCCRDEPSPADEAKRAQWRRNARRYRRRAAAVRRTRAWKAQLRADVEAIRAARTSVQ